MFYDSALLCSTFFNMRQMYTMNTVPNEMIIMNRTTSFVTPIAEIIKMISAIFKHSISNIKREDNT